MLFFSAPDACGIYLGAQSWPVAFADTRSGSEFFLLFRLALPLGFRVLGTLGFLKEVIPKPFRRHALRVLPLGQP
jgi:hypothetical protein